MSLLARSTVLLGLFCGAIFAHDDTCIFTVSPHPIRIQQPGGEQVTLHARGSAPNLWFVDELGLPVLLVDGVAFHAVRDDRGQLVPLSTPLSAARRSLGVTPIQGGATVAAPFRLGGTTGVGLHPKLTGASGGSPGGGAQPRWLPASLENLTILIRFDDHGPGGQNRTLPTSTDMQLIMNATGGDPTLAPTGSVRDYYLENSYGGLTLDSTVTVWVDVPGTESYYANGNSGLTTMTWELIEDALDLVDPSVNFSDFDQNSDGMIDSITFIHSGYGAEWIATDAYGTSYTDRMWSHRWSIPPWTSAEGVTVSDYHISPGLWDVSGSDPGRIGVICHETGHFLGLPDLYDTDGGGQGLGNWCLMAAGSWGFDSSQQYPSHMSAWAKQYAGWLTPETIYPSTTAVHTLDNLEDFPAAMRIDSGYPIGEYLLLENRQTTGFDAVLPEEGLLVYHVDESKGTFGANNVNTDQGYPGQPGWPGNNNHYRVAILQADGAYDLEIGNNRGDAFDIYHQTGVDEINDTTTPDTDRYQAGAVAANGNRIHSIVNLGPQVQFGFESPLAPTLTAGPLPFAVAAKPYGVKISSIGGVGSQMFHETDDAASYTQVDLDANQFAAVGVAQGWNADDASFSLALPFEFPYFGERFTTVTVSTNGYLDFLPVEPAAFNRIDYMRYARRIAPLWDDLRTDGVGQDIYVDTSNVDEVTIRWVGETFSSGDAVNFAVTLHADGRIQMHYGSGNFNLSPTVGISGGSLASVHVGFYDGDSVLTSVDSVEFRPSGSNLPPGMSIDPSGNLVGTPAAAGPYNFQVRLVDAGLHRHVLPFQLDVQASPPAANQLAIYPPLVTTTDTVTIRNCGGAPGNTALQFIVAVNGVPLFSHLFTGSFNANGVFSLAGAVPPDPNLPGVTLTLATFDIAPGNIVLSNPVDIAFH
jgi:M6 family metalloprotease-like protein